MKTKIFIITILLVVVSVFFFMAATGSDKTVVETTSNDCSYKTALAKSHGDCDTQTAAKYTSTEKAGCPYSGASKECGDKNSASVKTAGVEKANDHCDTELAGADCCDEKDVVSNAKMARIAE